MARETWSKREEPILEALAEAEARGESIENLDALAAATGLPRDVALLGTRALWQEGFLHAVDAGAGHAQDKPDDFLDVRLLGRGRRASGQWPAEDAFDSFVELLQQRIEEEPDPERKTRLQRLSDDWYGVGKGVAGALLAEFLKRKTGLS